MKSANPKVLGVGAAVVGVSALLWWVVNSAAKRQKDTREVDFQKVTV